MPADGRGRLRIVQTYLMVCKWRWLTAIMILIAVVVAAWGSFQAPTPSAVDDGGTTVQFWRFLAVGSASLPVLTLTSSLKELEEVAGPTYFRLRAVVLGSAFLASSALILIAGAVGVGPEVTPLIARALPAWFGLALVSGRVLGWHCSWILPCAAICALLYWGPSGGRQNYHWWEFTAQPATHVPSMLLAGGLFVAGIVAYSLSPWRIHRLRRSRWVPSARAHESSRSVHDGTHNPTVTGHAVDATGEVPAERS